MLSSLVVVTYGQNLQVAALESLEEVGDSTFQSTIDEDAIAEVVKQYEPQSVQITCQKKGVGNRQLSS